MDYDKLSDLEREFIKQYLVDLNMTQAYCRAKNISPSTKGIRLNGLKLYRKLKDYIYKEMYERGMRTQVTADAVVREAGYIALSDPANIFDENGKILPVRKMKKSTRAAIASIEIKEIEKDGAVVGKETKIKFWDKGKALDTLFKHHGLYKKDNEQKPVPQALSFEDIRNGLFQSET
jgi:phage terminase small subunit